MQVDGEAEAGCPPWTLRPDRTCWGSVIKGGDAVPPPQPPSCQEGGRQPGVAATTGSHCHRGPARAAGNGGAGRVRRLYRDPRGLPRTSAFGPLDAGR